ncbi:MAG: hypothetical protein IPI49_33360 [Myxococcales bacterium]|nr:hypothetical protein [Myxococcales bacterium]
MIKQLCAAKRLDPERSYPYQALAQLYKRGGRQAEALVELEHFVFLEQMDLAPLKELVSEYAKLGTWAKVRTYGEMALYISPADAEVVLALGRAYHELGRPEQALFTYDTALLIRAVAAPSGARPPGSRPGAGGAGQTRDARPALAAAMKTEPENVDVLGYARRSSSQAWRACSRRLGRKVIRLCADLVPRAVAGGVGLHPEKRIPLQASDGVGQRRVGGAAR